MNEPGSFVDASIVVVVTTFGGIETIVQKLPEIRIQSRCGPGSTIITPPNIGESAQPANQLPDIMRISSLDNGKFYSTNENCPMIVTLVNDGGGLYSFIDLTPEYEVRLQNDLLNIIDSYPEFELKAEAVGGAIATARGHMRIGPPEYECQSAVLTQPNNFDFFVPESGDEWVTLIESGEQLIGTPSFGCF